MSAIPMHNRFVEGFTEATPSGATLDRLSTRICPARLAGPDSDEMLRRARMARGATLGAALARAARSLAALLAAPARALIGGLVAWRRYELAAAELAAVDDRTLADLGLRRADLPFLLAQGGERRDPFAPMRR